MLLDKCRTFVQLLFASSRHNQVPAGDNETSGKHRPPCAGVGPDLRLRLLARIRGTLTGAERYYCGAVVAVGVAVSVAVGEGVGVGVPVGVGVAVGVGVGVGVSVDVGVADEVEVDVGVGAGALASARMSAALRAPE